MLVQDFKIYQIDPFWDDEYKHLNYVQEPFNDQNDVQNWLAAGYQPKFCGAMADMKNPQPSWNHRFVEYYTLLGWKDIGTSYIV